MNALLTRGSQTGIMPDRLKPLPCSVVPVLSGHRECPTVKKSSHAHRLREKITALREKAQQLPAGAERNELLKRAEQEEIALRVIQWIASPGELAPPSDLIPVTRHRLQRK
jgi:hypothetical protein